MMQPETVPDHTLATLESLVEARSGLRFVGGRRGELASKLARAFSESGYPTWERYQAELSGATGGASLDQLIEALTVGETYFFRHRAYFDLLEGELLPEIIARHQRTRQLRLWCAGCATGEEAYSLAIAVRRVLRDVDNWQVSILATDLNRAFLARAEAGLYTEWSFRETDAAFTSAYFTPEGRRFRIKPEVRRMVRFAQLNLAEASYPSSANGTSAVDLILCRNVLLYFGPRLTQQVVGQLRAALTPGGWLVLGPSDTTPGLLADFELHARDGAVVYRRVDRAETRMGDGIGLPPAQVRAVIVAPPPPPAQAIAIPQAPQTEEIAVPQAEEPDWREAWMAARASADDGDLDRAESLCQQAIAHARLRPEPYYLYGALRQARGDDETSLAAFRKALYVDPGFVPALVAQAAIHRRGGASERARQALVRAQRLLERRTADEWILVEDGLTVGRLQDAVVQALGEAC